MKVVNKYTRWLFLIFFLGMIPYFGFSQANMTVIVTFDQAPTTATAIKAPLKYNKDFALSMQIDDGNESIFTLGYPFFEGGVISGQTFSGLTYTDGCGNDIHFKMSSSQFSFNGNDDNGSDTHIPGSGYGQVTWPQMDTLYKAGWGIYNHGVNGNGSTDATFMNYSLKRNKSYTRRNLFNTTEGGVLTRVHVNPNGAIPYSQVAFVLGYEAALNQDNSSSFMGDNGGNVNSTSVEWSLPQNLYRHHNNDINVQNYVSGLADSSINGANYWGIIFSHSIGNEYPLTNFVNDFNTIEAVYGSNGLDNILMSTDEEIIDYLIIRDTLNVNSVVAGNNLIITINGNYPEDLRYYALSLVVNSDKNISNIMVTGADSVNHSAYGSNQGLINLFWDGEVIIPSQELADSMSVIAVHTGAQYDGWIAMDYVATMENGNHKDSLRTVLCGITGNTYDDGFCDFEINLGPDTTICEFNCDSIFAPDGFNSYTWMVADTVFDTIQNIYVCPEDTTAYILLAENDFGVSTDTIVYNVIPAPLVDLGNDTTICQYQNIMLYGPDTTGLDYTFEWYVADTLYDTTQNIVVSPLDTTAYFLVVNNSNGCSNSDSIWVKVLPSPVFEIIPADTSFICLEDSIEFAVSNSDTTLTYLWSTGDSTQTIKVSPVIGDTIYKYFVDVTNEYLCTISDTSWLTSYQLPTLEFEFDTLSACSGQILEFEANIDPDSLVSNYIWHYNNIVDTTESGINYISTESSTTIYLQLVTINECEVWDSIYINVNLAAEIMTGGNKVICQNDTATLEVTGADYYYWTLDNDTISTDSIVKVFPQDTTKYYVEGLMENGCSAIDSVYVYTLTLPETNIVYEGNNPACQYTTITLVAEGADTYMWQNGATSDTIKISLENDTLIELRGENENTCVAIDTLTIEILEVEPVVLSGLLPVYCENDPPETLIGTPNGGIFAGDGMVGDQFKPALAGSGAHSIVYRYTNDNTCLSTDTATTIVYGNESVINIGDDQTINPNESIELDAGSGFDSYYWSTGSNYQNITVNYGDHPPGSIIRYVVIGVINGCTSQGEVYITFADPDGIGDNVAKKYIVYPNPNTGTFTVTYLEQVNDFQIILYDYHGRLILKENVECSPDCDAKIELPKLPKGLYLIKTISEKGVSSGKIIIR